METKSHNVAVGLFVLAGLIALAVVVIWFSGRQVNYAVYQASFKGPVTGLAGGTPVRFNGIDAGQVTKVDFDPDEPTQVVAVLQVRPNVPVRANSVAVVESEGLTGGAYIDIEGGTRESPILVSRNSPP